MLNYKNIDNTVVETKTSNTIYMGEKAKQVLRHLNYGGGFDGFTPDFFCRRFRK